MKLSLIRPSFFHPHYFSLYLSLTPSFIFSLTLTFLHAFCISSNLFFFFQSLTWTSHSFLCLFYFFCLTLNSLPFCFLYLFVFLSLSLSLSFLKFSYLIHKEVWVLLRVCGKGVTHTLPLSNSLSLFFFSFYKILLLFSFYKISSLSRQSK